MLPVVTLESTIRDTALAAKRAAAGAADVVRIEVSVTNGYTAGATVPIQVIPISLTGTRTDTTTLTLEIKLKDYNPPRDLEVAPSRYLLNVKTGELTEVPEASHPDTR
jgi:hypothetical protein